MPQINLTTPVQVHNFTLGCFKKKLKSDKEKTAFLSGPPIHYIHIIEKQYFTTQTNKAYQSTIF